MSESGKYLVIDGVDGAGKSTQTKLLGDALSNAGKLATLTFEPGDTELGTAIRAIILGSSVEMLAETETDLVSAARRESIHQVIRPAMQKGDVVVSDRCWFSTIAMQGFGRGLAIEPLIIQAKEVTGEYFIPDGAVILDINPEVAYSRRQFRPSTDRFEKESLAFFNRAREGYHWIAETYGVEVIDASRSVSFVERSIYRALGHIAGI